jgi:RNA polymerase sigma factor (sigma-70 family)
MSVGQLNPLLHHVRRLADGGAREHASDAQLLARFQDRGEESAFASLMQRHARLVWSVCRRVLGHEQDAEDAFQATFLVLARKAGSIRNFEAVGPWLHGAAYRIAMRAKRNAAIRGKHERRAGGVGLRVEQDPAAHAADSPARDISLREGMAILDEEVERLGGKQRAEFVACCLEGRTMAEAARELGWKEGTVSGTLYRAKERLRSRLARRGVTLSAVLTVLALTTEAHTVPAKLITSTLKTALRYAAGGPAPAALAALIRGASKAMLFTKTKIAMLLLTLATTACCFALAETPPREGGQASAKQPASESPQTVKEDSLSVRGRVLDPDGKPVAGAGLYWPSVKMKESFSFEDFSWTKKANTDAEGRFELTLKPSEMAGQFRPYLVAAADGFGFAWFELAKGEKPAELTLRLVKDAPIEGRVLDTQGKPLAGVKLHVTGVLVEGKEKVDEFLRVWKQNWNETWIVAKQPLYGYMNKVLQTAATDADGHFTVRGLGTERIANVEIEGAGIAKKAVYVITRPGFDPKPYNQAVGDFAGGRSADQIPMLHGPKFDFVATPTRTIEGTILDVDTGKPIAGARLWSGAGYNNSVSANSDAQGHYKLAGLPKQNEYLVGVTAPKDTEGNLLSRTIGIAGSDGLGPIKQDIELAHGVVVNGRVVDKVSGKGIKAGVRFAPLPDNKFFGKKAGYDGYRRDRTMIGSDDDGKFRIVIIPGAGVLMAQVFGGMKVDGIQLNPYKHARFDPTERERAKPALNGEDWLFTAAGNSLEFLNIENAVKVVDFAEGSAPVSVTLAVDPGKTMNVQIQAPDGKPLPGVLVSGVTASWPGTFELKSAEFTARALDPEEPRLLVFLHPKLKLAGSLTLRGDEKEPPVVRLKPTGTITGRLLDQDGQPLAGINVTPSGEQNTTRELYRQLAPHGDLPRTEKDGRFRVDGVVPDVKFSMGLHKGRTYYMGEPRIGLRQVESGKTLDLGDVRIKPYQ